MSKAGSMRGLSFSEPTRISTSATSGRLVDEAVVLAALAGCVSRVRDQPLHLRERHAPRGPRGGNDVLLHHQGAEVVGPESQRHLTDLRAHRHPGRLDVGHVVEHDPRDRLGAQVGDGVGLAEVLELGVLRLQRPTNERDRKSTRLNSSHSQISYAVFCLKKKKTYRPTCPWLRPKLRPRSAFSKSRSGALIRHHALLLVSAVRGRATCIWSPRACVSLDSR